MVQVKLGAYRFRKESITELRQHLSLSQAEMGAQISVPKNTVSRWETGATVPDALQLAAIYSLGMEKNVTANFFARPEKQTKKKAQAVPRTAARIYWDMQNVAPSKQQAARWDRTVRDSIKQMTPKARAKFRAYTNPNQKAGSLLQGWSIVETTENCDEQIITQVRRDTAQNPNTKAIFLITRDRGYVNLIKEQRAKNVAVYVITPPNVSKKLVSAVGEEYLVTLP